MSATALWTSEAMAAAMRAQVRGRLPPSISGISIDSRTLQPGEAFFAIMGDSRDGHDFVTAALQAGAGLAVVAADRADAFADAPLLVVADVLEGLRDLARASRTRSQAQIVGVTGSVGKTGTKEALGLVLSPQGKTHSSAASYNNHWGVPLSLARCPQDARFGVFELGMNHAGEITPLTAMVRPHVVIITTIEPVHLEYFGSLDAIADAKAEIFTGLESGGAAVLNRDNAQYERLAVHAKAAGVGRIIGFGEHADTQARLVACVLEPDGSNVRARILGSDVAYRLGAPGRHLVMNSLAVLTAAVLLGGDLAHAAEALADLAPPPGRGSRIALQLAGGQALLIDESYNANPASMRAAIALLGQAAVGPAGRRIAVMGDMLELGPPGADLHRSLADAIGAHGIDLVFCCGPLMRSLFEALPSARRGAYAETSAALESAVLDALRPGDAIMVKGSFGSRMGPIVKALERRFAPPAAPAPAPVQG